MGKRPDFYTVVYVSENTKGFSGANIGCTSFNLEPLIRATVGLVDTSPEASNLANEVTERTIDVVVGALTHLFDCD